MFMIQKLLVTTALGSLLLIGAPGILHGQTQAQQSPQQQNTKSINGKVTGITNQGHSFTVESEGANKQTMEFLVDKNTQVQGQVKVGTLVTVDYESNQSGQNVCVRVAARA
jgi:hypothetical protein